MPSRAFTSDNTAGASPQLVAAVAAAAQDHALPYGADPWTDHARERLGELFEREVDLLITSTGSAANALALAAMTPPWGSVLCHRDSHINNDECGAPEFYTAGAKLVTLGGDHAKIDPDQLAAAVRRKTGDVHSVQPSALSITQATETGSLYTVEEIAALASLAHDAGLGVHLDGARFANAVAALGCTPAEMTWRAGVDILSFGATKNGAMTADAIVIFNRDLTDQLRYRHKRAGQLASKMRFHAAQFAAYLDDDLWLSNAAHANQMSAVLRDQLAGLDHVQVQGRPEANIVFCKLPAPVIDGLREDGFRFYHDRWAPGVCRFVTSFQTQPDDIDDLTDRIHAHHPTTSHLQ
jgi:threonine aldolase